MFEMNAPIGTTVLDTDNNGVLGQPMDRVDGPLKVTGAAKFSYEVPDVSNALYGFVATASIAKGRIVTLDTQDAERMPGVVKVLTWRDTPPQGEGNHREACAVLTSPAVEHYGQPIALVIAERFEQTRAGAYQVHVEYNGESAKHALTSNVAAARKPESAQTPADTSNGDFDTAFAAASVQLDVTYSTPLQSHAMMEPHATVAAWNGDVLTLFTANQRLSQGVLATAKTLKLPPEQVRLVGRYIGGGFGAKLWVNPDATLAALGARAVNRPVKVALTRQQVFHVTPHRSGTVQGFRSGTDAQGHIHGIGHDVLSGNLPSEQDYEGAANQTRTLYAGANRETRHRLVPLAIPVASAMRAPGEAVGMLALESAMDELAEKLQIDPIELRIRNEPTEDPTDHIPYSSRHLVECLKLGADKFGWAKRNPQPAQVRDGRWLLGIGVAAATRHKHSSPTGRFLAVASRRRW